MSSQHPWLYLSHSFLPTETKQMYQDLLKEIDDYETKYGPAIGRFRDWKGPIPRRQAMHSDTPGEKYKYLNTFFTSEDLSESNVLTKLRTHAESLLLENNTMTIMNSRKRRGPHPHLNFVIVNHYRDGNDYITQHNDKDGMQGYGSIVSYTFCEEGGARRFVIKNKESNKTEFDQVLEDGSVLIMRPGMQSTHTHGVPKQKRVRSGRINVTFRHHTAPYVRKMMR